jgi:hypothetical protein
MACPRGGAVNRLAGDVERQVGVTVSIGLAHNPLLAKLAAGRDKPRGFAVLGSEAAAVLAPEKVAILPGIGPALEKRLAALGLTRVGQLQASMTAPRRRLLGDEGPSLVRRALGQDQRIVSSGEGAKSISAETTFEYRHRRRDALEKPSSGASGKTRAPPARRRLRRTPASRSNSRPPAFLSAPAPPACRNPPLARPPVRGRPRPAGPRGGRHRIPPDRHRHLRPGALEDADHGDLADPVTRRARWRGREPSTRCAGASATRSSTAELSPGTGC